MGTKRIGVAISDPLGLTARPLKTIKREGCLSSLKSICQEEEVSKIVLGIPYSLTSESEGNEAPQPDENTHIGRAARAMESFSKKLQEATGLEVILVDEQFSSKEAEEMLRSKKLKNADRHSRVDQLSAAIILDRYLKLAE